MHSFSVELAINEKLFLRNPQRSEIGRRILKHGILLLDEIGLERFNFKKLAEQIGSTEATVYRYFENKSLLLLYLINWYWEWMKIHIDYAVHNIEQPAEKLSRAIKAIVDTAKRNTQVEFIDEDILHRIVMVEGTKAYHGKEVDEQNKEGFFHSYKSLCQKLADIIVEVNSQFPYPRTLATNLLEMANDNIYFAEHLPRLTEVKAGDRIFDEVAQMLHFFAFRLLTIPPHSTPPGAEKDNIQHFSGDPVRVYPAETQGAQPPFRQAPPGGNSTESNHSAHFSHKNGLYEY